MTPSSLPGEHTSEICKELLHMQSDTSLKDGLDAVIRYPRLDVVSHGSSCTHGLTWTRQLHQKMDG